MEESKSSPPLLLFSPHPPFFPFLGEGGRDKKQILVWWTGGLILLAGLAGCSRSTNPPRTDKVSIKQLLVRYECVNCHSFDGRSHRSGPDLKGLYGKKIKVVTGGETREVVADETYLRRSILYPQADLVVGYEKEKQTLQMYSYRGWMTSQHLERIVQYLKQLK